MMVKDCSECGIRMRNRGDPTRTVCRRCDRKKSTRRCDQCGVEHACFPGSESPVSGAFCSNECRAKNRLENSGIPCKQCGSLFIAEKLNHKYCSRKCMGEAYATLQRKQCVWCDSVIKQRSDKPSITCSKRCRYARMNLTAWMRNKQQKYKAKLRPPQPAKNSSWERWCECTAMQKHEWKPLTLEQRWKRKCSSMAGANRHRVPNVRSKSATRKEPKTWEQVCKTIVSRINKKARGKTLEQRWKDKMNSKASNHNRRMLRKAEMKRSQAERYSTD